MKLGELTSKKRHLIYVQSTLLVNRKDEIFLLIFRIKQTGIDPKNTNETESNEVLWSIVIFSMLVGLFVRENFK